MQKLNWKNSEIECIKLNYVAKNTTANSTEIGPMEDKTTKARKSEAALARETLEPRQMSRTLPYALLRAREGTMALFRPMLAKHGLSEQYWRVIRILHEFGELDIGQLSQHSLILGPSLSRMVKTMQSRKLLVISNGKLDQRRTMLRNSAKSEHLMRKVTAEATLIYKEIEQEFTSEDMEKLLSYLEILARRKPS